MPFQKPVFKLLVRAAIPILYEFFSLFLVGKGHLGVRPFSLGDRHLLTGGVHEKIGVIDHFQLERQLLEFFDGIMIKFFRALTNLTGRPINTIGQSISNPFPSNNFFNDVEKSSPECPTAILADPGPLKCRLRKVQRHRRELAALSIRPVRTPE